MLLAGALELAIAAAAWRQEKNILSAGLIAWLASVFTAYRVGLWTIGWKQPCGCLGSITAGLGIDAKVAENIALAILAYWLVGGLLIVISELRAIRATRQEAEYA